MTPIFTPSVVCRFCGCINTAPVQLPLNPRRRYLRAALWCTAIVVAIVVALVMS